MGSPGATGFRRLARDGRDRPRDGIRRGPRYMRPMELVGRDGLTIDEVWQDGPRAFQTVAIPGFPNFFMLLGPHSPVGNFPLTAVAETQADHILRWIRRWQHGEFDTVEPTATAAAAYNSALAAAMPGTVWTTGCLRAAQ